jgi:hypothetical protein
MIGRIVTKKTHLHVTFEWTLKQMKYFMRILRNRLKTNKQTKSDFTFQFLATDCIGLFFANEDEWQLTNLRKEFTSRTGSRTTPNDFIRVH